MDNFLRESLSGVTASPSQSVWKGITKRLIILELLRLNFTNIGKAWLYSGLATVATISGLAYFNLSHQTEETPIITETPKTEQITNTVKETEPNEIVASAVETNEISAAKETTTISKSTTSSESNIENTIASPTSESNIQEHTKESNINTDIVAIASSERVVDEKKTEVISGRDPYSPKEIQSLPFLKLPELRSPEKLTANGRGQLKPYVILPDEFEEDKKIAKNTSGLNWIVGVNYSPEWPLTDEDMYVYNHQYAVNAGIEFKKWNIGLGVGLRTEKTPSSFMSHYQSYDSVGYFYDIEYYEPNPENPDSIVLYYNVENIYDSVAHQSESHGPDQKRRWIFIPVHIGYQVYATKKYQLNANLFGQFGWETYTETADMNLKVASGSSMEDITPEANPNYLQIGIGFENNFQINPQWWIYAEPRINYYINTPYSINQTSGNGPYSFGLKVGVKYKLKRRDR